MGWNDEQVNSFVKITEGNEVTIKVIDIVQKAGNEKVTNLPKKDYYYEFLTDKGTLTVNSIGLFFALQNAKVDKGDVVRIKYIKKGSPGKPSLYEVTVIERDNPEI